MLLAQLVTCLLTTAAATQASPPPPTFRLVPLEPFPPYAVEAIAIDQAGNVAGTVFGTSTAAAARWDVDGTLEVLGRLETVDASSAGDIDALGTVVGGAVIHATTANGTQVPVVWKPDGTAGPLSQFTVDSTAIAISSSGQILATSSAACCGTWGTILDASGATSHTIDFPGLTFLVGLSDDTRVAGTCGGPAGPRAFRWSAHGGGAVEILAPSPGWPVCVAQGITRTGVVVGMSNDAEGAGRATIWGADGVPVALPLAEPTAVQGMALAGNAAGWFVGFESGDTGGEPNAGQTTAVLWVRGVPHRLADLVAAGSAPAAVTVARDVNDARQILAMAVLGGVMQAVRLDPQ